MSNSTEATLNLARFKNLLSKVSLGCCGSNTCCKRQRAMAKCVCVPKPMTESWVMSQKQKNMFEEHVPYHCPVQCVNLPNLILSHWPSLTSVIQPNRTQHIKALPSSLSDMQRVEKRHQSQLWYAQLLAGASLQAATHVNHISSLVEMPRPPEV